MAFDEKEWIHHRRTIYSLLLTHNGGVLGFEVKFSSAAMIYYTHIKLRWSQGKNLAKLEKANKSN